MDGVSCQRKQAKKQQKKLKVLSKKQPNKAKLPRPMSW